MSKVTLEDVDYKAGRVEENLLRVTPSHDFNRRTSFQEAVEDYAQLERSYDSMSKSGTADFDSIVLRERWVKALGDAIKATRVKFAIGMSMYGTVLDNHFISWTGDGFLCVSEYNASPDSLFGLQLFESREEALGKTSQVWKALRETYGINTKKRVFQMYALEVKLIPEPNRSWVRSLWEKRLLERVIFR